MSRQIRVGQALKTLLAEQLGELGESPPSLANPIAEAGTRCRQ